MVSAIAGRFFNETLKYNLWILMSCQMMPKRWFSIIINASTAASASTFPSTARVQTGRLGVSWPPSVSGPGHQPFSTCKNTNRKNKGKKRSRDRAWVCCLDEILTIQTRIHLHFSQANDYYIVLYFLTSKYLKTTIKNILKIINLNLKWVIGIFCNILYNQ